MKPKEWISICEFNMEGNLEKWFRNNYLFWDDKRGPKTGYINAEKFWTIDEFGLGNPFKFLFSYDQDIRVSGKEVCHRRVEFPDIIKDYGLEYDSYKLLIAENRMAPTHFIDITEFKYYETN